MLLLCFISTHVKALEWKGSPNGEDAVMSILAGEFVKADQKVVSQEGSIASIDAYHEHFANGANGKIAGFARDAFRVTREYLFPHSYRKFKKAANRTRVATPTSPSVLDDHIYFQPQPRDQRWPR